MEDEFFICTIGFVLFVFVLLGRLYYWSVSTFDYWEKRNVPYVKTIPLFGNTLPFVIKKENYPEMMKRMYKDLDGHRYGGYYEMREPLLILRDPDLCAAVLGKDFDHFEDRDILIAFNTRNRKLNPLSRNLFTLDGTHWKTLRQKINPVFAPSKLHSMIPVIRGCCRNFLDSLERSSSSVDIRKIMLNHAIVVNAACYLGVECQSDPNMLKSFESTFSNRDFGLKLLLMTLHPKLIEFLRISDFPRDVVKFITSLVKQTINYRQSTGTERKDFLQTMLNLKDDSFNETDIVANTFILFVGGYETTITSLIYCLHELAHSEEIQVKLRREITAVLNTYKGEISAESLTDFKYLDAVISETLRKYPVMPTIFRTCTRDYTIPNSDHLISKGTRIIIPHNSIQNDPNFFPEPSVFDPSRFLPDSKLNITKGCYLPYGTGPRYCIGMKFGQLLIKITIIEILSNFILRPSPKSPYDVKSRKGVGTLMPEDGIWINFIKV